MNVYILYTHVACTYLQQDYEVMIWSAIEAPILISVSGQMIKVIRSKPNAFEAHSLLLEASQCETAKRGPKVCTRAGR